MCIDHRLHFTFPKIVVLSDRSVPILTLKGFSERSLSQHVVSDVLDNALLMLRDKCVCHISINFRYLAISLFSIQSPHSI
jgi:hypothetical protein